MVEIHGRLTKLMKVRGEGLGVQDYTLLYALVRAFQVRTVVDIGTYQGGSALTIWKAIVDSGLKPRIWSLEKIGKFATNAEKMFEQLHIEKAVQIMVGDSLTTLPVLFNTVPNVDLVLIDGPLKDCFRNFALCCQHTERMIVARASHESIRSVLDLIAQRGWRVQMFPTMYSDGLDAGLALLERVSATDCTKKHPPNSGVGYVFGYAACCQTCTHRSMSAIQSGHPNACALCQWGVNSKRLLPRYNDGVCEDFELETKG